MNPLSKNDWKRAARRAIDGESSPGWTIAAGLIILLAILKYIIEYLFR
jgi:hypothetical protein